MNYFKDCKTIEEVKAMYKKLAFELHPDITKGDSKPFIEMRSQYEKAAKLLKNVHATAEGKTYEKESADDSGLFAEMVDKLVKMQNCTVELIGAWLWVTGDTKPYREMLKEMKFRWSPKKEAWYYHEEGYTRRSKKTFSLDEIRANYGSKTYKNETLQSLAN